MRATRQVDNSTAWQSKSVITLTALAWGSFHVSYKLRRAISFIRVGQGWLGTVDYRFHHQAMVTTRSKGKQAITSGHQQAPSKPGRPTKDSFTRACIDFYHKILPYVACIKRYRHQGLMRGTNPRPHSSTKPALQVGFTAFTRSLHHPSPCKRTTKVSSPATKRFHSHQACPVRLVSQRLHGASATKG